MASQATPPRPGTFLPFGSGAHACPGNDLAKLEMLVLIHRLVTTYRYILSFNSRMHAFSFPRTMQLLFGSAACLIFFRRLLIWCLLGRWQVEGSSDDVTYSPFPVPKGGLQARLTRAAAA